MKILLTGGGTAGHVMPHIALLKDFKNHFDEIIYIGSKTGIEKSIIEENKIKYFPITTTKFVRKKILKNLPIPFKLAKGLHEAKQIIKTEKPDVLFSKGGFVSLPVVLACHSLKIPIVIHESDLSMGLANKIASKYANKVCTTFKETSNNLKQKSIHTGSPMREDNSTFTHNFPNKKPIITIIGGSSGAVALNNAVVMALPKLSEKYNIIHIVGKNNKTNINNNSYMQIEFTNSIISIFKQSHIVISRAGSNTIFELLNLQIPMILVPLPKGNSRGDQEENAKYFEKYGLATILPQNQLNTKTLLESIETTEKNIDALKQNMQKHKTQNSNTLVLNTILNEIAQKKF